MRTEQGVFAMKSLRMTAALLCAAVAVAAANTAIAADAPAAKTNAPRLADGKPDFSGVWVRGGVGGDTFGSGRRQADGSVCILCPPDPPPGAAAAAPNAQARARMAPERPKYKPEFQAKVKELDEKQVEFDPALRCGNPGLPRIGAPDQIVHTPGQIVFLYNDLHGAAFRVIPTDGRPHRKDVEETYLGESVGKWEGDTLVIEAVKFVEDTWLIDDGAFHTPDLKVVERLRLNGDKLEYQATAHDPAVLAEPWQMRMRVLNRSNKPLNEPIPCIERDMDHVVDGTHHDNAR
jgi:hypothetical protein